MPDLHTEQADRTGEQNDTSLRWGGRAGILGSLLMLVAFVVVGAFVGMDITPEQSLTTFSEIRTARTVENTLYLVALLLWVVHSLGLYRALHRRSPWPALLGAVLSIVGLTMLIGGALPHVATAPLSDLYHASGATPQAQATLLLVWQGIDGVFDALLVTGLFIVPMGIIAFRWAMFGAPDFGARLGRTTVGLGVAGLAAAATLPCRTRTSPPSACSPSSASISSWAARPSSWPRRRIQGWSQAHDRHRLGGRPAEEAAQLMSAVAEPCLQGRLIARIGLSVIPAAHAAANSTVRRLQCIPCTTLTCTMIENHAWWRTQVSTTCSA